MVTRRSASIAASTQNSRASSAIQSEAEDDQSDTIRVWQSNTDEKTKAPKFKSSTPKSDQSHSRASSVQGKRKAAPPKLKLFVAKPPESIELQKIKHTLRNTKGAVLPTTQPSTERKKRNGKAGLEEDERVGAFNTITKGDDMTTLNANTQLTAESDETNREAGLDDDEATNGENGGPSLKEDTRLAAESNQKERDGGHGNEKTIGVVDVAGAKDGVSNNTSLSVNTETPLESSKRKREAGHEDEDGAHVADTMNGENDATTSRVDTERLPAKKRGRRHQLGTVQLVPSVELTPAAEATNGNPEIPAPAVKRPPGRPRKGVPPVSRQGSETAARRLPGRQRIPDANPKVEAIRVRMADLKRNFREVARAQEVALDNLAERSIDELRGGLDAHEGNDYFGVVQAGLDAQYVDNVIKREQNYQRRLEYEEKMFKAQQEVLRRECEVRNLSFERDRSCADNV